MAQQQEALLDTPTILKMKEDLLQQQRELQARSLKITGAVEAMLILEKKLKENAEMKIRTVINKPGEGKKDERD